MGIRTKLIRFLLAFPGLRRPATWLGRAALDDDGTGYANDSLVTGVIVIGGDVIDRGWVIKKVDVPLLEPRFRDRIRRRHRVVQAIIAL